ncbi:cysteine hydrolase [Actinokineospora auranticolor]|uniref:Isochorismate hydrolase n=1 Tax=Actinokineospora auranticolor TaxID=155976 RepID=A0A2S6GM88_9PSEU|nr:cysteine hydrolase [Actinokineospora auranticolor]PPK66354.1 isochorismate hydrolase [Actinokineospora auranticolor]
MVEPRKHRWHIEDREYARQEQRRGRRYAYPSLNGAKTALVVIDMVPFFVAESGYGLGIVPNIDALAVGVRAAGGVVAWVLPGPRSPMPADFYGERVARVLAASGGAGAPADRLWSGLRHEEGDLVADKTAYSAFFPGHCPLPDLLRDKGIDTVLITGTVTNVCCESSARDAATLGYRVVMVADANAARRDADHNATLHTVYRSFGDVRSTESVLHLLGKP